GPRASARSGSETWSVPVAPGTWPTARWLIQTVFGAFLTAVLGSVLTIVTLTTWPEESARVVGICFFALLTGLCLAAAVNGLVVARSRRRLSFLSVVAVVAATFAYGLVLYGIAAPKR